VLLALHVALWLNERLRKRWLCELVLRDVLRLWLHKRLLPKVRRRWHPWVKHRCWHVRVQVAARWTVQLPADVASWK
jgi:hypothetical protein